LEPSPRLLSDRNVQKDRCSVLSSQSEPQIPILPQAMSSDAENSAPTTGQKRQGALQLGPRKKPFVSMFAMS
jgi:hypothetical protein